MLTSLEKLRRPRAGRGPYLRPALSVRAGGRIWDTKFLEGRDAMPTPCFVGNQEIPHERTENKVRRPRVFCVARMNALWFVTRLLLWSACYGNSIAFPAWSCAGLINCFECKDRGFCLQALFPQGLSHQQKLVWRDPSSSPIHHSRSANACQGGHRGWSTKSFDYVVN